MQEHKTYNYTARKKYMHTYTYMYTQILKNAGVTPQWIEDFKELRKGTHKP
jgi:arabinogalactan endo-1,4-beta-galactosidase